MREFCFLVGLALLPQFASAQTDTKQPVWNDYVNVRFAYGACYPNWLRAGREADNSDGRIFADKSGAEMRVWGSYEPLVLGTTLREGADRDAASLSRVTYKAIHRSWYVVSGTSKGQIYYFKTLATGDRWISLMLRYPAAAAPTWNPLVKHIGRCLRALPEVE